MKYYKDNLNKVYAFEDDGSQDIYINIDFILMTSIEVELHINPPKQPDQIPAKVSMKQARLALLQFGILDKVNLAIQAGSEVNKITWQFANDIDRNDSLVIQLAAGLGLSSTDIDNLFTLANSL